MLRVTLANIATNDITSALRHASDLRRKRLMEFVVDSEEPPKHQYSLNSLDYITSLHVHYVQIQFSAIQFSVIHYNNYVGPAKMIQVDFK